MDPPAIEGNGRLPRCGSALIVQHSHSYIGIPASCQSS